MARTILVVDDEDSIIRSLDGILTDEGFDVLGALNGSAALEKIEEIMGLLELTICDLNCHLELTSAKTGEGIKEGFKWIFQELLKIA